MQKIFDAHFHIIDRRFPLVANQGYLPPSFTAADYLKRTQRLNIAGGTVVSGSFQAFDQTYLMAALNELGPRFVGVTQLPASIKDAEILKLAKAGVRGVRFNLKRGGSEETVHLEQLAQRIYALAKWHVELYADANELGELSRILLKLPAVSIDHLGLSQKGLPVLLSLVEKGVKVKATGFGRVDFDVATVLKEIAKANPDALMFGTDLPSTRAERPFLDTDVQLVRDLFEPAVAEKILYGNALGFYGCKDGSVS